ncbi:Hint domain-containing protein [Rhodophyticola sp. CCM32]|uniref:Hint domain-containing protein n=1 Tax=Rhodophyticola sp. CCM32 TaxID=2916397 RepID=UPI00143DFC0D|nr:Hint domain-containing protein [Rhodophyticola sp. CCM32]
MGTGFRGAFMISWAQTFIEGFPAEQNDDLAEGMTWRWQGRALPLEGEHAVMLLGASRDHDELRARAAGVVRKMLQQATPTPEEQAADDADPLFRGAFILSDETRFYTAVPVVPADGRLPILLFPEDIPPVGRNLTIIQASQKIVPPVGDDQPSVICFTPGTRLRTENGEVAIEDLGPGDRVLTRDDGPQEVLWSGHRRMSGARLFAMPDQRPIRMRAGALGIDRPDEDLIVSPEHRVLVKGRAAMDLWAEPEVLVRAIDLVGDRFITVDHSLRETFYVHLMLDRHQVVWANGLEVETFHPGFMGLGHLETDQRDLLLETRPGLLDDPHSYGPAARRMVSRAEAAILMHKASAAAH